MKYQTLQKTALATMALLTSLALSAQAGTNAGVSSAKRSGQTAAKTSFHQILFPDSTYMIDDGTAEDSVGFGNGLQNFGSVQFNQFDVIAGQTTISSVSVAWGTPVFPDPTLNGVPVTIGIWSDPNGDGNPNDAMLLGSTTGVIQNAGTDTFVTYTFSTPITLPAGATSFFAGDVTPMNNGPEQFFQGLDESSGSKGQSYIAAMSSGAAPDIQNLGNNDFLGTIDSFGLPGNWLIRADAASETGSIVLTASKSHLNGNVVVQLRYTGTDNSGTVDILRNGTVVATAADDGKVKDHLEGGQQTNTYQVCETGTSNCSNVVTVQVKQ